MAVKPKSGKVGTDPEFHWPYGRRNYLLFGVAILVILLGFYTLSQGSITWAPILLVLGYCVLIPVALILKSRPDEDEPSNGDSPTVS